MNTDRPDHDSDPAGPERDATTAGPAPTTDPVAETGPETSEPAPTPEPEETGAEPEPVATEADADATPEPVATEADAAPEPVAANTTPEPVATNTGADTGPKPVDTAVQSDSADPRAQPKPVDTQPPTTPDTPTASPASPGDPSDGVPDATPGPERLTTRPPRRWSPVLIASVAAAVLLVGGGGAYLASSVAEGDEAPAGAGADRTPPPALALDGYAAGGGDTSGIAAGEPNPYGVHYRAEGDLPDGPGSAPVYRVTGEVPKAAVARLAKALGLAGEPVARGESWQVGSAKDGAGPTLTVEKAAPGTWTFHRYAAGTDACAGKADCDPGPANPAGDPVGEGEAAKAAAPVLKALGQDGAKVDAGQVLGAQRVVNADPVIDGLPTYGWTTGLTVGADGELVGGTGRLTAPTEGARYPVMGAARTLALMNAAPTTDHRMGIGGCASAVPQKDRLEQPCGTSAGATAGSPAGSPAVDQTVTVEGAKLGLALRTREGRPVLVPSWLFQVRGADARGVFTATYPAVEPAYLTSPSAPSAEPSASGSAAPRDVTVEGYAAEGRELTVGFTGGVCADYRATAEESADAVKVTVTETPWKGKVCVMIAKEMRQKVTLDAPLGDRAVEGTGGRSVPSLKSGARLPETEAR